MRSRMTPVLILVATHCVGASLSPAAERAYQTYVADLEARLARQHAQPETYLAEFNAHGRTQDSVQRQLTSSEMRIVAVNGGTWQVPRALIHHWRASVFVPHATPRDLVAVLRDFDQFPKHYAPEVVSAHALADDGHRAMLAVRFREQRVLTVVLDGEYKIETALSGNDRGYSISRSSHLWQVDDPGTARERRRPEGQDDGFLWRLNSYWSFARVAGGLVMECEAVSLTRDVPPGLGWLVTPVIANLPREALEFTLRATRNALNASAAQEAN